MSDIRGITIAFAGDTTDIDQKFTKLKGQAKNFGLELEQVTKKIGSVQTVTSTLLGADGKNIVTTFANVNAELKLVAPNAEKAIEALKDLQELNLKQGGSLGITRIGAAQGTAGFDVDAQKLEKKRQDKLLEFDKETAEKRRLLTLKETFKDSETLKRIQLLRKEEELQAERAHQAKLAEIRTRLENPKDKYNKGIATAATNRELKRYEQEREQIRLTAETAIKRYKGELSFIQEAQKAQKLAEDRRQAGVKEHEKLLQKRRKAEEAYASWWLQEINKQQTKELNYIKTVNAEREAAIKAQRTRSEKENKENERRAREVAQNYAKWWKQILDEKHTTELRYIRETISVQDQALRVQKTRAEKENKENELRAKKAAQDYLNWWLQVDKRLQAEAARRAEAFGTVSGRQSQVAKTSAIGGTDNNLVTMRANIAQQEIEIERRKNQKLLGLSIALKKDTIALERANERRSVILQNYQQELTDLQNQKNKLRALEVKSTRSAGGFGLNFGDMAARVLEVNVLWNAINRLNSAISNAVTSIIPLGIQLDATKASLQSTAGGTAATAEILQALTAEAQRTGIEIGNLRQNFRLFQASTSLAGASMEKTWKMFTDLNTVSAALHLTTDQTNSVFLAMAQIFNKGKVQAEELVRQLGNLLPGAFASFAAANNMTTQKLIEQMEKGRVYAQDTMEKFTNFMANRFSGAFATASQALNADIGRMNSEFQLLGEGLYQIVRGPVQSFIQQLTSAVKLVRESTTETTKLNFALSALQVVINTGTVAALVLLAKKILYSTEVVKGFDVASKFLRSPLGWVTAITAIIGIVDELAEHMKRGSVAAQEFLDKQLELDKLAKERQKPAPLRIAGEVEKSPDIAKLRDEIANARKELDKLENGSFWAGRNLDTEKLNETILKLRENLQLTAQQLPTLNDTQLPDKKVEILKDFYRYDLQYLNEKLRLQTENLTKEKTDFELQQEKAKVTGEFGEKQEVKRLDQIKARLAEAEYQKTVAEQAKDWDKVERIKREILNLEKQKTEETKKGSEVAERIKKIYEDIETLGKRDREKGLNASEKQRLAELTTELTQLREVQRGFNAEVDKAALLEQARLKQKQTTQINKELPVLDEQAKTEIERIKTLLKEEETAYKNNERTVYDYYKNVATLREEAINQEILARRKKIELLKESPEKAQLEQERIRELQQEAKTVQEDINQNFIQDLKKVKEMMDSINVKYLENVGKYGEAGLAKANKDTEEQIQVLTKLKEAWDNINASGEGQSFIDKSTEEGKAFIAVAKEAATVLGRLKANTFDAQAEGFFKQYNEKAQFLSKDLAIKEIILRTKQKSGAITEFGALMERQEFSQEYVAKMQAEQKILEENIAKKAGMEDAASLESVERWRQELNEKKALLAEFEANSELIADRFQTIFTEAFGTAFANFVTGTTTAAEAFQNFAKSVIASLANIAAQEMATQIFSIFKTAVGGIAGTVGTGITGGVSQSALSGLVDSAGGYPFAKGGIPAFESFDSFFEDSKNKVNFASGGIPDIDGSNSFFEDSKNKVNFASGGIPDIGSVKQTFMMANGGVGTLRERGPEAILPLQRDSKGNLGVSTTQTTNNEGGLQIGNIQINVENKKEESGPDLANTIAETLVRRLADEQIQKASRPGNLLNKTTRFGNG